MLDVSTVSGADIQLTNNSSTPVCIDTETLYPGSGTQGFMIGADTVSQSLILNEGESVVLRYGPWTTDNGSYSPYLDEPAWWCIDEQTPIASGVSYTYLGEGLPEDLSLLISTPTDLDGDGVDDLIDPWGSYVQTQSNIWEYQNSHTVLTVGKTAVALGSEVIVTLISRNLGASDGTGTITDTVPAGWSVTSTSPTPDSVTTVDGVTTLTWSVLLKGTNTGEVHNSTFSYTLSKDTPTDTPYLELPAASIDFHDGEDQEINSSLPAAVYNMDNDSDGDVECATDEVCDGADNDGDGTIDEDFDADSDGTADCFDVEVCDGADNNGDGSIDEGFDADADGTADCFDAEECDGADNDGDGSIDEGWDADDDGTADCFDVEVCDGLDNNGDGSIDEGFDADSDGTADCFDAEECDGADNNGDGYVDEGFDGDGDGFTTCQDDCDDANANIHPDASEGLTAAPYAATSVVSVAQGLRKGGTPVLTSRSNPTAGLEMNITGSSGAESDLFSLGFGGSITVAFDPPLTNGDGDDLMVYEGSYHWTSGSYVEKANVYAWDGATWVLLGEAKNNPPTPDLARANTFDLGALDQVEQIRIVDTTSTLGFRNFDDGFDLNGVYALHDAGATCDGIDNNCDGNIDEGFDADGDGAADCLDTEVCDGLDNNGDGQIDEGFDADGDGTADCFDTEECDGADNNGDGSIDEGFDANDNGTADCFDVEVCDGLDNNGDGYVDEGFDADGDGFTTCQDDCDDSNSDIHPDASEGLTAAPYAATSVVSVAQGLRKGGTPVLTARSNPTAGLEMNITGSAGADSDLFSLGFGGSITVAFDPPLTNGDGDDLMVYEGSYRWTSGSYVEKANVYAWDGAAWVLLGEAKNNPPTPDLARANTFDLGALDQVEQIRIVDTTSTLGFRNFDDGFDLNGVYALHDAGATCDGIDNNCDGATDEGFDADSDGTADCFDAEECDGLDNNGDGQIDEGFDSNGNGTADCFDAEECDGLDNNGDGSIDEGFDSDSDGTADCFDVEVCDGADNNGDGATDEGFDADGDGTADCFDSEACDGADNDGDGATDEGFDADGDGTADCFDAEECDGADNDGDGSIDEGFDADGDGYSTCVIDTDCSVLLDQAHGESRWSDPYETVSEHAWGNAVDALTDAGYTWATNHDTITADALAGYDAVVIAEPVAGFSADEVNVLLSYVDAGGGLLLITDFNEEYINPIASNYGVNFLGYSGLIGWTRITDWQTDLYPVTTGIDDVFWAYGSTLDVASPDVTVLATYGGVPVFAQTESGAGRVVFSADNEVFARYGYDGIYDSSSAERDNASLWLNTVDWLSGCGEAVVADCDDSNAGASPDGTEVCDGVDNDCDGLVDEGFDADGDGTTDCTDTEACDGVDNDGDGAIDEDQLDSDGDGTCDALDSVDACEVALRFCSDADGLNVLEGGGSAVLTYSSNPRWTAALDGAQWIWDESLESNPTGDEIHSIFRSFDINSGAYDISGTLTLAADNSYTTWLNGLYVGADTTEFNYFDWSVDSYDISSVLVTGENQFEWEIWNWAQPGGNGYTNPGGLLYCVDVSYSYDITTEICDGQDNDCDGLIDEDQADTDADGTCDDLDEEVCDGLDNDGNGYVDELAECAPPEDCEEEPVEGCLSLYEALSQGALTVTNDSSGVVVSITNTGSDPVCLDEQILFTSDQTQAFFWDTTVVTEDTELAPGETLALYYGSWTTSNGYYQPYAGLDAWWCVESAQLAAGNATFTWYGEIVPEDLAALISGPTDVDGDGVEDHVDWAGTYGVQSNYNIWNYQATSTILTVGKAAEVNGDVVEVTLTVRNFGANTGLGTLSDTIPAGWSLVSARGAPSQVVNGDGSTTLSWTGTVSGYVDMGGSYSLDSETVTYTITRDADTPALTLDGASVSYHDGEDWETSWSLPVVVYDFDGNGDSVVECDGQ